MQVTREPEGPDVPDKAPPQRPPGISQIHARIQEQCPGRTPDEPLRVGSEEYEHRRVDDESGHTDHAQRPEYLPDLPDKWAGGVARDGKPAVHEEQRQEDGNEARARIDVQIQGQPETARNQRPPATALQAMPEEEETQHREERHHVDLQPDAAVVQVPIRCRQPGRRQNAERTGAGRTQATEERDSQCIRQRDGQRAAEGDEKALHEGLHAQQ